MRATVALALLGLVTATAEGVPPLLIEGRIVPASGVVVPADASWIVELRDEAGDKMLAQQRQMLAARGWLAAFTLRVDKARSHPGRAYSVRTGARVQGRVGWHNRLRLSTLGKIFDLDRSTPPQVQRFEYPGDPSTFVIVGEQRATVSVHGQAFAACVDRGAVPSAAAGGAQR